MTARNSRAISRTRDSLYISVSNDLESRILSGEMSVGENLPSEKEIAHHYDVSTRSAREAIQTLETKGLVRRHHGERTAVIRNDMNMFLDTLASTVRQLFATDPSYLIELMEVRRMVEVEAIDILSRREKPQDDEIEAALEAMRSACNSHDFVGFTGADAAFHLGLVRSSGNKTLSKFYERLYELITDIIKITSRVPSKSLMAAYAEHMDIYNKIVSKKGVDAKDLMRMHIENSANYLRVAIEDSGLSSPNGTDR